MTPTISLSRPAPWRALQAVADLLRQGCAAWRRQSEARRAHLALRELDARSLRDLGFDRSELGSLVAEIDGQAGPTRVRVLQAFHGLRV
jgi:uncharacterized protein YjiS (DUF1127 family)